MKAARTKLRITAGPAREIADAVPRSRPVPMEPPTATMVICPAVSWWRRPDSESSAPCLPNSGFEEGTGMRARTRISEAGGQRVDGRRTLSCVSGNRCGESGFGEVYFGQSGCGMRGNDAIATGALGLVKSVVGELEEEFDPIGG